MTDPEVRGSPGEESQGGAGMMDEHAPIGFNADVGGAPRSTDDPDEARAGAVEASAHGPRTPSEQQREEE